MTQMTRWFWLAPLVCFCQGCALFGIGMGPNQARFSPDDRLFAYVWEVYGGKPIVVGLEHTIYWHSYYVRWQNADSPCSERSVLLETSPGDGYAAYIFSPDSKHIAAVTPHRLTVVEIDTGRRRRLAEDCDVSSFGWRGNDEVVYVTRSGLRWNNHTLDRRFWRRKICAERPVLILEEAGLEGPLDADEIWSPDGEYCLFISPHCGRLSLLTVRSGQVGTFGRGNSYAERVSWRADSSSVYCMDEGCGADRPPPEHLIIDAVAGQATLWHPIEEAWPPGFPDTRPRNPHYSPDNPHHWLEAFSHDGKLRAIVAPQGTVTIGPAPAFAETSAADGPSDSPITKVIN